MNINIICVGKLKEKYLKLMEEEYSTRLSKFIKLNIIEIREEDLKNEDEASINIVKIEEGKRIIETIKKIKDVNKEIYILAINGKEYDTLGLKDEINKSMLSGKSSLIFIIGGSYGLSDEVLNLSRKHISFSKLTFPHQLFRCILLEQIYRVYKIINNEPYHK